MFAIIIAIFFCQIVVVSIIVPHQYHRIVRREMSLYPEKDYPRLYTLGTQVRLKRQNLCLNLNHVTAVISFFVLAYGVFQAPSDRELVRLFSYCFLLQLSPYFLLAYWEWQVKHLRSKMPAPIIRTASLAPRQLSDIISPLAVVALVAAFCLVIVAAFYALVRTGANSNKFILILLVNTGFGVFALKRIFTMVRNPREDPYAANSDEMRKAQILARTYVITGLFIAFSSLFSLAKLSGWFDQDSAQIYFMQFLSLLYQAGLIYSVWAKKNKLKATDYSVFKDADETSPLVTN